VKVSSPEVYGSVSEKCDFRKSKLWTPPNFSAFGTHVNVDPHFSKPSYTPLVTLAYIMGFIRGQQSVASLSPADRALSTNLELRESKK